MPGHFLASLQAARYVSGTQTALKEARPPALTVARGGCCAAVERSRRRRLPGFVGSDTTARRHIDAPSSPGGPAGRRLWLMSFQLIERDR